MSPLPKTAWKEVSVDFKKLSTGRYMLVNTDDYSRYTAGIHNNVINWPSER